MHDGISPIVVPAGPWPDQHRAMWDLLVPPAGNAETIQGEVIRLTGRLAREILYNGGLNWDADFQAMLAAVPEYLAQGNPLSATDLDESRRLVHALMAGSGKKSQVYPLSEFAVAWVCANPRPVPLPEPAYRR